MKAHVLSLLKTNLIVLFSILALISISACSQTPETPDQSINHSKDDEYWAELAQNYEPFEIDSSTLKVAAIADRDVLGEWGSVISWPHIPVSAAQLPDGRLLTWASYLPNRFGGGSNLKYTYAATWDPKTGKFIDIPNTYQDAFCAAQVLLEDGRVLVNGGNSTKGKKESTLFDYRTNKWIAQPDMNMGRWYNTSVALPNGTVFTALGGGGGQYPERWTEGQGWKLIPGINLQEPILDYSSYFENDWHPFLNLAPNGKLFNAGPTPQMHWIDPNGNGSIKSLGTRPSDWYPKDGVVVMYEQGKLLFAGGTRNGIDNQATDRAMTIDINQEVPKVTLINALHTPRRFSNGVVLPSGEVLVIGGNTNGIKYDDQFSVLTPELWNPQTQTWRELADMSVPRNYHSTALLLPDGRVWSGGGGLCGSCPGNHLDAQLFSPPYLFNQDGSLAKRPTIIDAPATIKRSEEFTVKTSQDIKTFRLIKLSSLTHSVNTDLRAINLTFDTVSSGEYKVKAHDNINVMTPGYWMLFALNDQGVPSVASVIQVSSAAPTPKTFALTVNKLGAGTGTISSNPAGINCGNSCSTNFNENTVVSLNANPATGSSFAGWSGACSGTASCVVTLSQARTVSGSFNLIPEPTPTPEPEPSPTTLFLGVSKIGNAANEGHVVSNLAGLDCGSKCSGEFVKGSVISLTASNSDTVNFAGWSGGNCSGTDICKITLNEATTITATFNTKPSPTPNQPLEINRLLSPAQEVNTLVTYNLNVAGGKNPKFRWQFGDGSNDTTYSNLTSVSHTFARAGRYLITVTATDDTGTVQTQEFLQIIHNPLTSSPSYSSNGIAYETRNNVGRVWVVNPDNNSVSVFNASSLKKLAEIEVGKAPRNIAFDALGRAWVSNKYDASISLISPDLLSVSKTLILPIGSQPYGLVADHLHKAMYVVLEASGKLLKFDYSSGNVLSSLDLGENPRHISINAKATKLYISRFISPAVPGESSLNVDLSKANGEILVVATDTLTITNTILLQHSNSQDSSHSSRGIPNYLGPAVISADGLSAWVPSKQDNIARGTLRDGQNLNFENTVRSISSYINLNSEKEDYNVRIDFDNGGIANSAAFDPLGIFLYVALEGSREVAVIDATTKQELSRIDVGRAPEGLVVSPDGKTLYTQNFMDRSISVHDLSSLYTDFEGQTSLVTTLTTVSQEKLSPEVLKGKQFFYDAKDLRLAKDSYMSCAACHNDGSQDGRVWDLSGFGEGLRNTISLMGHGSLDDGHRLHWSANFDEVQDFEGQIRSLAGGTGLMPDSVFSKNSESLGNPKTGLSSDLDALAAYVKSLNTYPVSPYRDPSGSLSADAFAGKALFERENCAGCHTGNSFSDSFTHQLHDVGTLNIGSGNRLGAKLTGINTPGLRGVWSSAPYLHNGAANTLNEAVKAHNSTLSDNEIQSLVTYLEQIDGLEAAPILNSNHKLSIQNNTTQENVSVNAGDENIASLNISLQSEVETQIKSLTFASQGTGNELLDLETVNLYLDVDNSGSLTNQDIALAKGSFKQDNGTLTLKPDSNLILSANTPISLLVTSNFKTKLAALFAGSSFALLLLGFKLRASRKTQNLSYLILLILLLASCSTAPQPQTFKKPVSFKISLVAIDAISEGESTAVIGLPIDGKTLQLLDSAQ